MELAINKITYLATITSRFLAATLYKWLFPVLISITALLFADKEKNNIVLCTLWLFHIIAYLSIPLNYEKPKRRNFQFLTNRIVYSIFWTLLQATFLSAFLFIITLIYIIWYLPEIGRFSVLISLFNSVLYFLSIILGNFTVVVLFYKNEKILFRRPY